MTPWIEPAPAPPGHARERELQLAAGGLLGAAAVWPVLPMHPPFACPLRSLTGIPCPLCGMTRACVALAHGHVAASLAFNPAGILVVALAAMVLFRPRVITRLRPPVWMLVVGFALLWIWNIGFNPTFHQLLLR
jgi:hypothetical protein